MEYYQTELAKINIKSDTHSIVIADYDGNKTKAINLNADSIPLIIELLQKIRATYN